MSFEGYNQYLCKKGHLSEVDVYFDEEKKCHCGDKYVWRNQVDQTNGMYCECGGGYCTETFDEECEWCDGGRIDGYVALEVDTPEEIYQCTDKKCGRHITIAEETYKIPTDVGHKIDG
jgi:hypothetical protein